MQLLSLVAMLIASMFCTCTDLVLKISMNNASQPGHRIAHEPFSAKCMRMSAVVAKRSLGLLLLPHVHLLKVVVLLRLLVPALL